MASVNLPSATGSNSITQSSTTTQSQANVISKEYYVKVPKTKKRHHAIKFNSSNMDLASWSKPEMMRDMSTQPTHRTEWENMPKFGAGSEFGREAKEMARRRKFGYNPKRVSPEDFPWIITTKGVDKGMEKGKDKQYIGKKSVTENSSYFVFIKCSDGGFEAHPLEDWYSFAPHKTYKTLNEEEAEAEYKRRHKILNKHIIMVNKRKNQGDEEDEEEDEIKAKHAEENELKKKKNKNYKSSNLSDEDEEETNGKNKRKLAKKPSKKAKKHDEYASGDEFNDKEDSDDGDREGLEKDYSSSGTESESEPETTKFEEKYQEKGIDEEEAVKALDKSEDEEEEEEDEGLTEEGKEYRKLMNKDKKENDEFDEFFRTGTLKNEEDSKESSSTLDESDLDGELDKKKIKDTSSNKLKRKATDDLSKNIKKTK